MTEIDRAGDELKREAEKLGEARRGARVADKALKEARQVEEMARRGYSTALGKLEKAISGSEA